MGDPYLSHQARDVWRSIMCTAGLSSWAPGGAVLEDGDGTDLTQVYNPKTAVWTEVAPMQIARSGSAACTLNGKIYVIGRRPVDVSTDGKTLLLPL